MRGTIQQQGATSWRIRAYVGRDSTGKKRYVSRTVHGTRRDAEKELSRLLVEVDEGRHVASPTPPGSSSTDHHRDEGGCSGLATVEVSPGTPSDEPLAASSRAMGPAPLSTVDALCST